MDKNEITLLINSLNGNPKKPSDYNDLLGKTAGALAKSEQNIAFLVNSDFVHENMLRLGREEVALDWWEPSETLDQLSKGLLGKIHDVPVYGNWFYVKPGDIPKKGQPPRFGLYRIDTKEIFPLSPDLFCA
ncbi:hypothetical protein pEaSNUABM13_00016 [Erwinia phage pEa_SNUABM_13]|nr:hypothetical protein pEaSNUABM13_00016 [Erwinia phage pEa_SNUABM_13]